MERPARPEPLDPFRGWLADRGWVALPGRLAGLRLLLRADTTFQSDAGPPLSGLAGLGGWLGLAGLRYWSGAK